MGMGTIFSVTVTPPPVFYPSITSQIPVGNSIVTTASATVTLGLRPAVLLLNISGLAIRVRLPERQINQWCCLTSHGPWTEVIIGLSSATHLAP